jgi:hypothetical protein
VWPGPARAAIHIFGLDDRCPSPCAPPPQQSIPADTKVLTNAKVERNGKHVGTVPRVMVDPTSGRITHVGILMTEGQQRPIAVPWSGVRLFRTTVGT